MRAHPFAVFFVLALLWSAGPAGAQTVLFQEDFTPTAVAAWQPSPLGLLANWSLAPGTASYNGGGHTQIYAGDPAWTDYRVAVRIRLASGSNHPGGLRGRVDPATGAVVRRLALSRRWQDQAVPDRRLAHRYVRPGAARPGERRRHRTQCLPRPRPDLPGEPDRGVATTAPTSST